MRFIKGEIMHYKESKGILSQKNNMNIYRGCTHGCIYCDGRSTCYQFKHQYDDVEVKVNATKLLEQALRSKRKKCIIGTGYISDSYMQCEKELEITRQCLALIDKYNFGVTIQTKSKLILRDLDILKKINSKTKCVIQMTLTTYDEQLCKYIEPNVCSTRERYETLKILRDNNIPTVVWIAPILPYINDTKENIQGLLNYCKELHVKGIVCYGIGVTLREGNRQFFYQKLDAYFPGTRELYERKFSNNYYCASDNEDYFMRIIKKFCDDNNILLNQEVFDYMYEYVDQQAGYQLELF